jgi:hypothetical protein
MTDQQILTEIQNEVRKHLRRYMKERNMVARHLALQWGISEPYMSGLLYSKNNFKLSTLIELGIRTGYKPVLSFQPIKQTKSSDNSKEHASSQQTFSSKRCERHGVRRDTKSQCKQENSSDVRVPIHRQPDIS